MATDARRLILGRPDHQKHPTEGLQMPTVPDVAGTAALAICEALMLALNDRNILPEHEILGVLRDAAAAHENDPGTDGFGDLHTAVAALINKIIAGGKTDMLKEMAEEIGNALDTVVKIQLGRKKGQLIIEFGNIADLRRISDRIQGKN